MIIEDISFVPEASQSNEWNGIFRMSSIGGCDRALHIQQSTVPALGGGGSAAAQEGHLHEMDVVMRLKAKGYELKYVLDDQETVTLTYAGQEWPNIIGHPDGMISGGSLPKDVWYVLEIKSMGAFVWPRLKDPIQVAFPVYYGQAQFYLHSKPDDYVAAVIWVAKNRSSGELRELVIRRDPQYMDERLAAVSAALEHHKNKDPYTSMECSSSDYVRKYCPYRYMCETGFEDENIPKQVITDLAMREAAQGWRVGKAEKDSGELKIKESRKTLEAALRGEEITKGMLDGLLCQLVDTTKTSYDTDTLFSFIPHQVIDEAREKAGKEKKWTALRVTDKE